MSDLLQIHLLPVVPPVLFNTAKHHLKYLQSVLLSSLENGREVLSSLMPVMGNNLMDLYIGNLSPAAISSEIITVLHSKQRLEPAIYSRWIKNQMGHYYNIQLSDHSEWTLLQGLKNRYIHIHPARYSPHTVRIKALSLKTACWVGYTLWKNPGTQLTLELINQHRIDYLKASPVKSVKDAQKLLAVIELFISPAVI